MTFNQSKLVVRAASLFSSSLVVLFLALVPKRDFSILLQPTVGFQGVPQTAEEYFPYSDRLALHRVEKTE